MNYFYSRWLISSLVLPTIISGFVAGSIGTHTIKLTPSIVYSSAVTEPPRFGVFSKNIVGPHYIPGGGTESVEILGEDIIKDNGVQQSGPEFIYFEDGSYCSGPVDLSKQDYFTASFELSTSRVYVEGDISEDGVLDGNMAMEYPRVPLDEVQEHKEKGDASTEEQEILSNESSFMLEILDFIPNFAVRNEIKVASDNAWDRNSLAWSEEIRVSAENSSDDNNEEKVSAKGPYQLWLMNVPNQHLGFDMNLGIACTMTGYVKSFVRSYNENGGLVSVMKLEGQLF